MPDTYNELLKLFMDRDQILFILFAANIVLTFYLFQQMSLVERFFRERPKNLEDFLNWKRLMPKESKTSCPDHGLWIPPGKKCYATGCKWRRDKNGEWTNN